MRVDLLPCLFLGRQRGQNDTVPLTVRAWLTRMPPEGAEWPETQYEQWHAAFRAMTDAIYRHG